MAFARWESKIWDLCFSVLGLPKRKAVSKLFFFFFFFKCLKSEVPYGLHRICDITSHQLISSDTRDSEVFPPPPPKSCTFQFGKN